MFYSCLLDGDGKLWKVYPECWVRLLGIEGDIYQSLAGVDVPSHLQGLLSPWSRVKLGIFNFVEENTEGLVRTEHLSSYWTYSVVLKCGTGATGGFGVLSEGL